MVSLQEMLRLHRKDGYFQGAGCAQKWPAAREKYCWDAVCELCPKVAAKFAEVPNWLRERFEIGGRKGSGTYKVSEDLYEVVDAVLEEVAKKGMELNTSSIEEVLKDALQVYNETVNSWRIEKEKADAAMLDGLCDSGASEEEMCALASELAQAKELWPKECILGRTPRALNQVALSFARRYGWSSFRQDKPQKHLPRDHPQVARVTQFIRSCIQDGSVHPKLVGNWDQAMWC